MKGLILSVTVSVPNFATAAVMNEATDRGLEPTILSGASPLSRDTTIIRVDAGYAMTIGEFIGWFELNSDKLKEVSVH